MADQWGCPERDCKGGHGFTLMDCDDRCPDYDAGQFEELLKRSSLNTGAKAPASVHAAVDQARAAARERGEIP